MGSVLRTLAVLSALLAGLCPAAGLRLSGFAFNGVSNRVITPNGDGRNDNVAFRFSNPRDAAGAIKIYDLRGHQVASIAINPGDAFEVWDGRSGGRLVDSGAYIYVVSVDGSVYSGALVVVR